MVKKMIFYILILTGFLSCPVFVMAQECTARITKTDTWNNYPEVTIQILNAGIENGDTLRIASDRYSSENLVCPLGFTANSTNPLSVTCSLSSRHLELNELNKISVAYSGSGGAYGELLTEARYPTITGSENRNNWTDPDKIYVADNDYGYIDLSYPNPQYRSQSFTGFGSFNIPENATITAITIETKGYTSNTSNGRQLTLALSRDYFTSAQYSSPNNDLTWLNPQSYIGQSHTYTTNPDAVNFTPYNWTPEDFNNDTFSIDIWANSNQATRFSVDFLRVLVTYRTYSEACFGAYINSIQCGEFMGTLCPSNDTGGIVVPKQCDPLDIFCKVQQWAYGVLVYWFGFDEEFSQDQFSALMAWLNYKFPFGYLTPLASAGFGEPLGSPSASLRDVDISFTPKMVHGGQTEDLDPVILFVPKQDWYEPIEPFANYIRIFFGIIIFFSAGLFIVSNAHKFFE